MKLHANAALSLKGRRHLCQRVLEEGWTVTEAAAAAEVTVRCARKWIGRYQADGEVDVVFDVIGGEILQRSTALVRAGGTLVTIAEPPTIQPENGRAIFFVVEADRSQLAELAQRLRDGRLASNVGAVRPLAEAPAAFGPDAPRVSGKTVIRVTGGW